MRDLLQFFIAGVAAGAIYALVGLGLVIIYKATHVLNFAHGALMMVGAYLTYQLHAPRHPIQGPPGFAWPYWVAVPAAMALTGASG